MKRNLSTRDNSVILICTFIKMNKCRYHVGYSARRRFYLKALFNATRNTKINIIHWKQTNKSIVVIDSHVVCSCWIDCGIGDANAKAIFSSLNILWIYETEKKTFERSTNVRIWSMWILRCDFSHAHNGPGLYSFENCIFLQQHGVWIESYKSLFEGAKRQKLSPKTIICIHFWYLPLLLSELGWPAVRFLCEVTQSLWKVSLEHKCKNGSKNKKAHGPFLYKCGPFLPKSGSKSEFLFFAPCTVVCIQRWLF